MKWPFVQRIPKGRVFTDTRPQSGPCAAFGGNSHFKSLTKSRSIARRDHDTETVAKRTRFKKPVIPGGTLATRSTKVPRTRGLRWAPVL